MPTSGATTVCLVSFGPAGCSSCMTTGVGAMAWMPLPSGAFALRSTRRVPPFACLISSSETSLRSSRRTRSRSCSISILPPTLTSWSGACEPPLQEDRRLPSILRNLQACSLMPINTTHNETDRLDTLYVLTGGGVNADAVTGADEERHLDDEAGLGSGRLGAASRGVTLEARLGIGDGQHNFFGQVDGDRFALVEHDVEFQVIDQVVLSLAKLLFGKDDIVKGAGIHKVILVAILVLVGGRAAIQVDTLELIARVAGAIKDGS